MQPFLEHEGCKYYRLSFTRPGPVELPFTCPYPCLLWDHAGNWTQAERASLVSSLLDTDCRYAVCADVGCAEWHDDIDMAFISGVPENAQDARFIMTTWHTAELPLEVAWFFAWNTEFDDHVFQHYVLIELGHPSADQHDVAAAVTRAVTDSEAVVDELDRTAG